MKMPVPPPLKPKATEVKVEAIITEARKIVKDALEAKKDIPPASIISLDDDEEGRSLSQRKESSSKKTTLKKMKEKLKEAKSAPKHPEKLEKHDDAENKRKDMPPIDKPRQQITDIKVLELKEIKA